MPQNPLISAADAAGDRFATTESGTLQVPGESPTTYQWQRYTERYELEVENKGLGHVLREVNGPEHDKVPSHIDIENELPEIAVGEGITARDVMRRGEQRAKALRENTANDARRASCIANDLHQVFQIFAEHGRTTARAFLKKMQEE